MLKIITVNNVKEIITRLGIQNFFLELITELKKDFNRWPEFQKTPRLANHFNHGVIEIMPICDQEYYTFKYVNGHPYNPLQKKQTVIAMGLLAEVTTGYPLMISEMTLLTAFRTAATSALAASYLAKENAKSLGIIGTGAQAEFLILAHQIGQEISKIKFFDIDTKAMEKFSANLSGYNLQLEACQDVYSTIHDVDVIITATAARKRVHLLQNDWIKSGVHISGIGGDAPGKTEIDPAIIRRSKVVVEYYTQSIMEGEIQNLENPDIYAELWEIVSGNKRGRENDEEITFFDSVGFALEDYSVLKLIYRLAEQFNIGEYVNLIPQLDNPKDLFGLLK